MQHASQRSPTWADLQPELLLHVVALLGNEERWGAWAGGAGQLSRGSALHSCRSLPLPLLPA